MIRIIGNEKNTDFDKHLLSFLLHRIILVLVSKLTLNSNVRPYLCTNSILLLS